MADIFLSHSSADNAAADQIKNWLERDRPTWSVFLDKHPRDGILAGQGWQDRLRAELQSCRLVVAIISDSTPFRSHARSSPWGARRLHMSTRERIRSSTTGRQTIDLRTFNQATLVCSTFAGLRRIPRKVYQKDHARCGPDPPHIDPAG